MTSVAQELEQLNKTLSRFIGLKPAKGGYWQSGKKGTDDFRSHWPLPKFTQDLNLCAEAEALMVARGFGPDYMSELFQVVAEARYPNIPFMHQRVPLSERTMGPDVAHVAMASAELRSRAMVRVLQGQVKP